MANASQILKAAVIGLGAMGRHHVRVYGELSNVELVAVADVSADAVQRATRARIMRGYVDYVEMLEREQPDIVTVAVPTSLHRDVVLEAVRRGVNVLVEKPIAGTVAEAREMIVAADQASVKLMVGHIERFNPAVIELKRRLPQAGQLFQISARRIGPFPDRIRDVGVVIDLASHDIDTMRYLVGEPAERLYAETAQRIHTAHEDMIVGTIRFRNGVVGALEVNWLAATKIRQLSVVGSLGTFIANYLTQDLQFSENSAVSAEYHDLAGLRGISEGNTTGFFFQRKEPLRQELEAFVDYVLNGGDCPAPPEDATETLAVALGLIESANRGTPVLRTASEFDMVAR